MISNDRKGAIAEAALTYAAVRLGFGVARPLAEGERYDLIFDLRPGLIRVQCKWAACDGEAVIIRCYTSRRCKEGFVHRGYRDDEVDAIAAYCADVDQCYLLPRCWIGPRRSIRLRLERARNNQSSGVTWAPEFELDALDWRAYFAGP